ncbi:MAG: hypothetical protein AB8B85_04235 [Paracoccaceae bacterium]
MLLLGRGKERTIHIHVGPHKTGSTAIQHDLHAHRAKIAAALGITPIADPCIWSLAAAMNRQNEGDAERLLTEFTALCRRVRGDILVSCEDFAGELPGRTKDRRPYPRLWPALNRLRKAFPKDRVRFYFFTRDPDRWLRSSYAQLLKYRQKFKSFDGYMNYMKGLDGLWEQVTDRPRERLGEDFVVIPYEDREGFSASAALFEVLGGPGSASFLSPGAARPNSSPSEEVLRLLEEANKSGASNEAVQAAKLSIWDRKQHAKPVASALGRPPWPSRPARPEWLSKELEALWSRTAWRGSEQEQPNLMPALDSDLTILRGVPVEAEAELPDVGREKIENQARILAARFQKSPQTCYLLGLVISYLRRSTGHEEHASILFQRLWAEEYPVLLGFLPTRWLISTFQTFLDHGVNENQRAIGAAAFFMSNTLKLYEAERALDGLAADATYPNLLPATKSGFWGLDRFKVGGTDLMLNTNAHLLELAARDDRAGRVLQEFLLRMKRYHTAFSRMDQTRQEHDIDIPPFSNCWSFFEPPEIKK